MEWLRLWSELNSFANLHSRWAPSSVSRRRLEFPGLGAMLRAGFTFAWAVFLNLGCVVDSRLLFVALEDGQELMGFGKAVSGVEFKVSDPGSVEKLSSQVLASVGNYPYRSTDCGQLNSGIFTALKLQKIVMFLVLTFIVIVAAFNIASTLFMAVVKTVA